ncbi:hypothetical protein L195_g052099, partial [Trifolium pratense]
MLVQLILLQEQPFLGLCHDFFKRENGGSSYSSIGVSFRSNGTAFQSGSYENILIAGTAFQSGSYENILRDMYPQSMQNLFELKLVPVITLLFCAGLVGLSLSYAFTLTGAQ